MTTLDNDILQQLTTEKVQVYAEIYKQFLPKSVDAYNFLIGEIKWKKKGDSSSLKHFELFVPSDGNINNGTIFAIINENVSK